MSDQPVRPGYTRARAASEPTASIRKAEELLGRYMPEDARERTLGTCGEFGCFLLAGVP